MWCASTQAHELSRIAARHGALDIRPLPRGRLLVQVDRRHVMVEVALGVDGRPAWSRVTAEPDRDGASRAPSPRDAEEPGQ